MTSRLKRKLGDIGVDTSSAKANENFCLIGTPLPPLEKSRDTGEFVPLWKQEVRDEKGRRRLHGAFTGGFSAGYFNTVGSKEGWTPQTFISSRSDRTKKKVAKPEDFMDEEDMQDIRDSRKIVDTTDEMDLTTGRQPEGQDDPDVDPLTTALQSAILPPSKDSVGARILKKMGWRVGQGIGPRISFKQWRLQDLQSSARAGLTLPRDEDSEEASKHTYAPRDTPVLVVERKDNSHGLGYRPGMSLNDSLGVKSGNGSSTGPNISSGFGLGALNDADEDDLDVYDGSSANVRNRIAYDASDHHDGSRISLGGSKSNFRSASGPSLPTTKTFRDGTAVLPGFVLSAKPVMEDRWYPLPDIPPGWKPDPKRVWSQSQTQEQVSVANKENVEQDNKAAIPYGKWKTSGLSADERGSILGETPLPSAPRSVFDYMSQKDRERLKNITASLHAPPTAGIQTTTTPDATSADQPSPAPTTATPRIPRTDPQIARAALNGFKPFPTNPIKQARYTAYLQSQADISSIITLEPLPHQSIPEFNSEMEEYAQSAVVFKPMSGAMAGRFTTAAIVEHGPQVIEGLHTPAFEDKSSQDSAAMSEDEKKAKEEQVLSPKENAARIGMYGSLTRETIPWQPARLLCKRFGVKDPNPEPKAEEPSSTQDPSSTFDSSIPPGANASDASTMDYGIVSSTNAGNNSTGTGGPRDLANVGLGDDDDTQGRDTLTYERPSVDIFKAIFASDDEDSSDEEGDEKAGSDHELNETKVQSLENTGNTITFATSIVAVPSSVPALVDDNPVDFNTFKPTFVRREARTTTTDSDKQEKKGKKDKKKEKRKAIVSFMDDDAGDSLNVVVEKPKKKRKKDKEKDEKSLKSKQEKETSLNVVVEDDDDMWVEKPAPPGVNSLIDVKMAEFSVLASVGSEVQRGRKRAVDFL
ncbi:hypothetical protein J3R30DRAFT_3337189 [Lentinula aciculospora]|uniref:G-patch domain-containing protein n=1 Tax=Lentinula aciculospora TaxID=153920 RepID=A0A9W9DKL0_9AGAR|nr:hypothetical protein J3R30DRAFT_3337189 [Lentinula aciculospora]